MQLPLDSRIDEILDALQHPDDYKLNEDILIKIQHDVDDMKRDNSLKAYQYKIYLAQALLYYHRNDDEKASKFANAAIESKGADYPEAERFLYSLNTLGPIIETVNQLPVGGPMKYLKHVLINYGNINGRARRAEYWYWVLFWIIGYILCVIIDAIITISLNSDVSIEQNQEYTILSTIFALVTLIPYITVTVRRLHDVGYSGWYYLIGLIPLLGWAILLTLILGLDDEHENKYGLNPLYYEIYQ